MLAETWLLEFAKGAGRFFLNPVIYFSIILAVMAGWLRVKRERKDFHVRVHGMLHELKLLLPAGLAAGAVLSIIAVATGFTVPFLFIAAAGLCTIVLGAAGNARLLSPAFTAGLAFFIVFFMQTFDWSIPGISESAGFLSDRLLAGAALAVGILLIAESFLMFGDGDRDISPKLRPSRRGLIVGAHQAKRLWLLPVFLFIPVGEVQAPFSWWPVIEWGTSSYTVFLVPFLLGFLQQVQSMLPERSIKLAAREVLWLGLLVTGAAAAGFWVYPSVMAAVAAALAIIGRALISWRHRTREGWNPYYFAPRNSGIMVLGTIPDSPADRMGLSAGEIIQKCNGLPVRSKQDLYEALLENRAYCKLEVYDVNGEIRLLQRALYEGDHHELGILFIEERHKPDAGEAG